MLLYCFLMVACSDNSKKITFKWVVDTAAYHDDELITVGKNKERLEEEEAANKLHKGNIYDIRKDGTFTAEGILGKREGTWELHGSHLSFKISNGLKEDWYFPTGVEVRADSSISIKLEDSDTRYTLLVLKPAPGQNIKTDYNK